MPHILLVLLLIAATPAMVAAVAQQGLLGYRRCCTTTIAAAAAHLDGVLVSRMYPRLWWYCHHVVAEVDEHVNAVPVPQPEAAAQHSRAQ